MIAMDNLNGERRRQGRIEVICGSMFSGKTEELIRRLKRAKFAKQRVEIFKPSIDTRYSEEDVVSHDQNAIRSTPIDSSGNILLLASNIDVVGIDEAQFLDEGLTEVCNQQRCAYHHSWARHGFQGSTIRTYPRSLRHSRRSDESTCYMREMWRLGIHQPSASGQ
jgi:hypothetical protein